MTFRAGESHVELNYEFICHRHDLPLTRAAILFGKDCKPDTRAAEIEPICCPSISEDDFFYITNSAQTTGETDNLIMCYSLSVPHVSLTR